MCETATRAIWFDALCRMHERKQGYVKGTIQQLCRMLRCSESEMKIAIEEIENLGIGGAVMDCNNIVTIKSRRKTREFKDLELNRLRVNRHRKKAKKEPVKQECNGPSSYSDAISITNTTNIYKGKIGLWFNRRESTKWTKKELKALKEIGEIDDEDFETLEKYYTVDISKDDYRRQTIATLLNNWPGELDRARNYKPPHQHGDQYEEDREF